MSNIKQVYVTALFYSRSNFVAVCYEVLARSTSVARMRVTGTTRPLHPTSLDTSNIAAFFSITNIPSSVRSTNFYNVTRYLLLLGDFIISYDVSFYDKRIKKC